MLLITLIVSIGSALNIEKIASKLFKSLILLNPREKKL